jgi:DNA polymerase III subunit chi
MTDISFYHLQKSRFEEALPVLLEKTLEVGKRALVKVGSSALAERLNSHLWDYQQGAWLPHGTSKDGRGEHQPIWLTSVDENPNGATFLFLGDGACSNDIGAFERCFEMFDGNDAVQLARARERWQSYKNADHSLKYLQQTERGGWVEKATD